MKIKNIVKEIPTRVKPYIDGIRLAKSATRINKSGGGVRYDDYNCGDMRFIWGVTSDGSEENANLWTMNDIDITYDSSCDLYYLGLETIYSWVGNEEDRHKAQKNYLLRLYSKFKRWMTSRHYDTDIELSLYQLTTSKDAGFDSIPEAFAYFRILVAGFCAEVEPTDE